MNIADTKKALLTAQRAFDRAMRSKTCALANTNLRHGQKAMQEGHAGVRKNIPAKLEPRYYSPAQRELIALDSLLPNAEMNAHMHRLETCGTTQMQHERAYWESRVDKTDSARERQYRKRPKKARRP